MPPQYLIVFIFFFPFLILAQNVDFIALEDEISNFNDQHQYEASILRLDEIIHNPLSEPLDKTHAYIQKAFTYKRVYNYAMALSILNLAEEEALRTQEREELESKIWAEQMLIYFDMQDYENVEVTLKKLVPSRIDYLTRETRAFYHTVLGYRSLWKKAFEKSEEYFNEAISILEKENPKHLPNIYRAKLLLYSAMDNHPKVFEAFESGLNYAEKYRVDIYDIIMHEALTKHYIDNADFKNAFESQVLVSEKRQKYNAHNISDALLTLENNLFKQRKSIELEAEKKRQSYLIFISIILIALIIVLLLLLRVTRHKNRLVMNENRYIRLEVERLSSEVISINGSKHSLKAHKLTERQLEVIQLVKEGKTNKEIGEELFISENTVKYHLKAIYELLGVENRTVLRQNYM